MDKGNIFFNMLSRIRFTKEYARLEAPFVPVDLRQYEDIYVYCDSDPIGYYLNQNKIPYHAMEDGLNCLKNFDAARFDNRGMFGLKAFMSNRLNLIFVQNGYGKYCLDMEVNDISAIAHPCPKYIEVSRQALTDKLTAEDKEILIKAFVRDEARLKEQIKEANEKGDKILILTDPLCSLEIRRQILKTLSNSIKKRGPYLSNRIRGTRWITGPCFPNTPSLMPHCPWKS